jgi:glucose-6-phosphate 1-dehydrogenase
MIELKESFGCEGRGGYFDEFGIVRDVLQNRKSGVSRIVLIEGALKLTLSTTW